jgi:Mg2+/citrate symporter
VHKQQKAAITVRCTEDIEASLKSLEEQLVKNAESSDKVRNKIFWLNVVLAIASLVGAIATVAIAIKA